MSFVKKTFEIPDLLKVLKMNDQVKKLIALNKITEAIQLMQSLLEGRVQRNNLIIIENRWNKLNEKLNTGTISSENAGVEQNAICDSLLKLLSEEDQAPTLLKSRNKTKLILGLIAAIAAIALSYFVLFPKSCDERKVALLVADFMDTDNDRSNDAFANTLVTRLDYALDNDHYEVRPVGFQTRNLTRYDDAILKKYYTNTCDTSGMFINGLLDLKNRVFNIYVTIANLRMEIPEFSDGGSLILDNPEGITFSIPSDARFLADFFIAIIKSYEGKPLEALNDFNDLIKNDTTGFIDNQDFNATLAHFRGN